MKKKIRIVVAAVILVLLSGLYAYGDTATAIYNKVYDTDNSEYRNSGVLYEGTIEQQFTIRENDFTGIMIKTTALGDVSKVLLEYEIQDMSTGNTCITGQIPAAEFKNDKFKKIEFDENIENSSGKQYKLILSEKNGRADAGLGIYYVPAAENEDLMQIRGQKTEGALLMKTLTHKFNIERFIVLLVFVIYIVLFLKILYKLFK